MKKGWKEKIRDKSRDNLYQNLVNIGVDCELAERGINEEKLFNPWYRRSLGIININSDFDENNNINTRVFEALSCGCLLFTDENKNMKNFFKPNKHVVYFKSDQDLRNKINYYKKNIDHAFKIAKEGNSLFYSSHQSKIRIKKFNQILKNII